jgi:hypothetical protein
VVRLSLPRSLSSSNHPNIPPSTYHPLLIVIIIIMANVRSTSGENDIHHYHVGWNHHFILEWMYWELLDLAEWATLGVFREAQQYVSRFSVHGGGVADSRSYIADLVWLATSSAVDLVLSMVLSLELWWARRKLAAKGGMMAKVTWQLLVRL